MGFAKINSFPILKIKDKIKYGEGKTYSWQCSDSHNDLCNELGVQNLFNNNFKKEGTVKLKPP